jgi:hypothetical protein
MKYIFHAIFRLWNPQILHGHIVLRFSHGFYWNFVILKVCDVVGNLQIGDIIIITLDHKHKYLSNIELDHKSICLILSRQCLLRNPNIYLFGNFMEVNKITYVKKGDGDYWFVNLIRMVEKLVKNILQYYYFHKLLWWSLFCNKLGDLTSVWKYRSYKVDCLVGDYSAFKDK